MAEMYYFSKMYGDFIYFYRLMAKLTQSKLYPEELWPKFYDLFSKKYIAVYEELNQIKAVDVEYDINRLLYIDRGMFVLSFPLVAFGNDIEHYIEENLDKMIITEQIYESTLDEVGYVRGRDNTYVFKKKKQNLTTKISQ